MSEPSNRGTTDGDLLRRFIATAPVAIAMFDTGMRYLAASRRWLDDYHVTGDVVGRSHYDIFPEIPEQWREVHRRCLAGAEERSDGERFDRADGTCIWLRREVQPWRDQGGEIGGIVIFTEDITDRVLAEEELRRSEELFQRAFHVGPAGMTITNISDGMFRYVNESFLQLFEFTREEVIGRTSIELNMWTTEERTRLIGRQAASGGLRHAELQARSRSGKLLHLLFSSNPIEMRGERCLVTTLIDITERKALERELLSIGEQLNRTLGQELHDTIGQNIFALSLQISAFAERLKRAGRPEAAEAEQLVDSVRRLSTRTRALVQGLFPASLDEGSIVEAIEGYAEEVYPRLGVRCRLEAAAGAAIERPETAFHLFRIVQEAVTNAVRHAGAREVVVGLARRNGELVLTVQSNGAAYRPPARSGWGIGLRSMELRAKLLGGTFEIGPGEVGGAIIRCVIPEGAT